MCIRASFGQMAPRPRKGMTGCALESPEENLTGRIHSSGPFHKKNPILPVKTSSGVLNSSGGHWNCVEELDQAVESRVQPHFFHAIPVSTGRIEYPTGSFYRKNQFFRSIPQGKSNSSGRVFFRGLKRATGHTLAGSRGHLPETCNRCIRMCSGMQPEWKI